MSPFNVPNPIQIIDSNPRLVMSEVIRRPAEGNRAKNSNSPCMIEEEKEHEWVPVRYLGGVDELEHHAEHRILL